MKTKYLKDGSHITSEKSMMNSRFQITKVHTRYKICKGGFILRSFDTLGDLCRWLIDSFNIHYTKLPRTATERQFFNAIMKEIEE